MDRQNKRNRKWFGDHPDTYAPEPYGASYRILDERELRAMLPYLRDASSGEALSRRRAVEAHLAART